MDQNWKKPEMLNLGSQFQEVRGGHGQVIRWAANLPQPHGAALKRIRSPDPRPHSIPRRLTNVHEVSVGTLMALPSRRWVAEEDGDIYKNSDC